MRLSKQWHGLDKKHDENKIKKREEPWSLTSMPGCGKGGTPSVWIGRLFDKAPLGECGELPHCRWPWGQPGAILPKVSAVDHKDFGGPRCSQSLPWVWTQTTGVRGGTSGCNFGYWAEQSFAAVTPLELQI